MLASKFSAVYHVLTVPKNQKAKFKVTVTKYLNTYSFYSVDECLTCQDEQ